jgi:Rad3-related DNA helicase
MTKGGVSFDCIWPGRYAERWLWTGVPRIALMSATLRPKALAMLGLSESKYWFKEFPRVFPAENNPVVWIPTGRMGVKADEAELRKTIIRSDEIYDEWAPGYKGIVHTASYRRAEWLQSNSRWGRHMLLNKAGQAVDMAERFRKSKPPCILVSPSYTTGWDFPDQDCEWQHIIKLPFPDLSDPIVSARRESDQDWMDYETMQTLVQASGRGTRHYTDKCVVMITDDAVGKFRNYARRHSPTWFSISESKTVPKAPK